MIHNYCFYSNYNGFLIFIRVWLSNYRNYGNVITLYLEKAISAGAILSPRDL